MCIFDVQPGDEQGNYVENKYAKNNLSHYFFTIS